MPIPIEPKKIVDVVTNTVVRRMTVTYQQMAELLEVSRKEVRRLHKEVLSLEEQLQKARIVIRETWEWFTRPKGKDDSGPTDPSDPKDPDNPDTK